MLNVKTNTQKLGRVLSAMIMPNIGAFIAWGLITALFIPDGWLPNDSLVKLVGPMITYLLPILIGYTGGSLIAGQRGAVMGAITTMGVIVGSDIPMFLGAMIAGPFAGYVIKTFDKYVHGKVKAGFEMLVNNFSIGILGMITAIFAYFIIGPTVAAITDVMIVAVEFLVEKKLLPLISIIVEPAKVLFLNNAINHGVFSTIGTTQAAEVGKSIFYLIETNPGPGLGVLLAYMFFTKGAAAKSAYGASIIHFFGGIHEVYFPYVLMKPKLVLAVILGGMSGVTFNMLTGNGLVGPASPGSVFALSMMSTKGIGIILTLSSIAIATLVSFVVAAFLLRNDNDEGVNLSEAQEKVQRMKDESKGVDNVSAKGVRKIIVACDAGMGSSAMGATLLRDKINTAQLNIEVTNSAINDLQDGDIIITQEELTARAKQQLPNAEHLSISNFMDASFYDDLVNKLKN